MTTRERMCESVEQIPDEQTAEAVDYLEWLVSDEEVLAPEELEAVNRGIAQSERGEYVTLEEAKRSLKP